jgi:hypothetical protein
LADTRIIEDWVVTCTSCDRPARVTGGRVYCTADYFHFSELANAVRRLRLGQDDAKRLIAGLQSAEPNASTQASELNVLAKSIPSATLAMAVAKKDASFLREVRGMLLAILGPIVFDESRQSGRNG